MPWARRFSCALAAKRWRYVRAIRPPNTDCEADACCRLLVRNPDEDPARMCAPCASTPKVRAASAGVALANPGQGYVFRTKQSGCMEKVTDEVDESEIYGALPLSYGAAIKTCAGGTRTHDPRLLKHVLQFGSRSVLVSQNAQRRFAERSLSRLRPSVSASKSPIVDWPLCLGETLEPFASRSPGIATLRPSWTPKRAVRQLS